MISPKPVGGDIATYLFADCHPIQQRSEDKEVEEVSGERNAIVFATK